MTELLQMPTERHAYLITYAAKRLRADGTEEIDYHSGMACFPNALYAELAAMQILQQSYPEREGWQLLPLKLVLLPWRTLFQLTDQGLSAGEDPAPDLPPDSRPEPRPDPR